MIAEVTNEIDIDLTMEENEEISKLAFQEIVLSKIQGKAF